MKFGGIILKCRDYCGACCTAPSITTAIPGMANGKAAGIRCIHLNRAQACDLFGLPQRPKFCQDLQPSLAMCGNNQKEAMDYLLKLEITTNPELGQPQ